MKSKAQFKGHPVHPILVMFPVAFFFGTFIFDVISLFSGSAAFAALGRILIPAGIIAAVFAATAGIFDFIYTVPPNSTGKKRAARHGLLNTTAVIIFALALYLRQQDGMDLWKIVAVELAGVIVLSVAGWMGGTLVYRNQIGVDIRYAGAGKWKEHYVNGQQEIEVADAGELKTDQMKLLHVQDKRIVLARTEEGYVAFDDRCPHRGGSLAGGAMICGTVQCPWHGTQFSVKTGEVKAGPGEEGIRVYNVSQIGEKVFLRLE